ncbi:AIPR family protein [uncultured Novosphingobium sp.]|uniref:AIPR family protein n=1 Tax=uncultured Novosphingobium sp. TaxID=292277 RepID=UPI002588988F|nr:AIPR family protein [uncultured Novosphingobium sp.]
MSIEKDNPKSPLILGQIAARLHEIFDGHIDLSDVENKNESERNQYFLTRAYLALFFLDEVGLSASEAAAAITDGGADDGIDAIHIDKKNSRVYFGQSKWRSNMDKGVELTDFVRFRDGVKNVLSLTWTNENACLHRFKADLEQQLLNIDTDVYMVLAHTSGRAIADNIQPKIDQFVKEENEYNPEFVSFHQFRVPEAAKIARSHTRPENISFNIMLANWGLLSGPYRAAYGSVAALDVVNWFEEHGNKLFAENLRYGIEKSEVNDGIMGTAHSDPEVFWYYNNGITAICESVDKLPLGGPDTSSGVFDVKKISVINGAQTITSLARAKQSGANLAAARVHLRIISLNDTPEDFSGKVTSANNTQNDLNPVDFVAADPNQDRIRREALQNGLFYTFRRGDKEPERSHGFTVRSATVAAACASGDLRLAVSAKRYISGLWESTKKEPYTKLFNDNTSAIFLWRAVQIMNVVDDVLLEEGAKLTSREKLTSVHGNRFILFYVFESLGREKLNSEQAITELEAQARDLTILTLAAVNEIIAERYPEAYPGNIFKNQERQSELLKLLPQD